MVTITDSGIRHTIYETVYDIINAAKNNWTGISNTPTLYGGLPDLNTITFPSIIIMPIEVSEDSPLFNYNEYNTMKSIVVRIMCFAKSNKDIDYMGDGVTAALRNSPFSGAFLTNIGDDNSFITPNDQKIKVKTLSFTYMRR